MKIQHRISIITILLAFTTACGPSSPPEAKNVQAEKARQAANTIKFTGNAEIDNIKQRLELTSNPGLLGFVVLFNEMGQPIMYTGVKGKITSGSKRLTSPDARDCNNGGCWGEQAPSDEGTYGSSNPYIFFWTTDGQYIQWSGHYLYSDKPFRLKDEPVVVAIAEDKESGK